MFDDLADWVRELDDRIVLRFTDEYFRESFLAVDTNTFRSEFLHTAMAPTIGPSDEPSSDESENDYLHVCQLRDHTGLPCDSVFRSPRVLRSHQIHTTGGDHGTKCEIYRGVVANYRLWCDTVLANRRTAYNRTRISQWNLF